MIKLKKTKLKQKQKQKQSVNVVVNVNSKNRQVKRSGPKRSGTKQISPSQPPQPPRPQYMPQFIQQPQIIKSGVQLDDVIRNNEVMRQFVRDAVVNPKEQTSSSKNHVDHSEMIKKYIKETIQENMPKTLFSQTPVQTLDTPYTPNLFKNISDNKNDSIISRSDQEAMVKEADALDGKEEEKVPSQPEIVVPEIVQTTSSSTPSSSSSSSSSSTLEEEPGYLQKRPLVPIKGLSDTGYDFPARNTKKLYKLYLGSEGGINPIGEDGIIKPLSTFTKNQQDQMKNELRKKGLYNK
jgi:hypothetical protein